jgi:hypothetical protein
MLPRITTRASQVAEPTANLCQFDNPCRQHLRGHRAARESPARRQARRSLTRDRASMRRTASRLRCGASALPPEAHLERLHVQVRFGQQTLASWDSMPPHLARH